MAEIEKALNQCDVFIAIGTSGHVYPAAGFLASAKQQGSYCIGINLDAPLNYDLFDEFHQGKAGEILPNLVSKDSAGNPVGINYTKFSAYLIEALKELASEVNRLKSRGE